MNVLYIGVIVGITIYLISMMYDNSNTNINTFDFHDSDISTGCNIKFREIFRAGLEYGVLVTQEQWDDCDNCYNSGILK